jgi:hypothetical protein
MHRHTSLTRRDAKSGKAEKRAVCSVFGTAPGSFNQGAKRRAPSRRLRSICVTREP